MCNLTRRFILGAQNCKTAGSFTELYIMREEDWAATTITYDSTPNSPTFGQITALTGIPAGSIFRIDIDGRVPNTMDLTQEDSQIDAYAQSVVFTRKGYNRDSEIMFKQIRKCCNLVVLVKDNAGVVSVLGIDEPTATGPVYSGMAIKINRSTGGSRTDTPQTTYTIDAGNNVTNVECVTLTPAVVASTFVTANLAA